MFEKNNSNLLYFNNISNYEKTHSIYGQNVLHSIIQGAKIKFEGNNIHFLYFYNINNEEMTHTILVQLFVLYSVIG